ncbi:nucleotidyltransferase family protein [Sphingobium subterraneum]|uniref:Polymerase nucleotidyl transferase domain-containing protein n=1 Tax=Sphingobium subterraneum TaxID=627688 RepID=A0A841J482_9SPHN|nr:nucleotidyltransferase domain-containing protein [Sphingobium subterraneum]MBB6124326.1 hypothetical protein [Sphingobium subterraneum]
MTREEAITRIRAHEAELRAAGMSALYLFGSTARGEAGAGSDVDLSCDLKDGEPIGLLDFIGMQQHLEAILGARVDLVESACLYPRIERHAAPDMVRVF